jgi:hypothetical protein
LAKAGVNLQAALLWSDLSSTPEGREFKQTKGESNMAVIGVSYAWTNPAGGGYQTVTTTGPTTTQAYYLSQLMVQLTAADADTTCTITHNWALTAAEQANLYPQISWILGGGATTTVVPTIAFTVTTNTITVLKTSVVGSQGTYIVTISRPNTIIR